MSVHSTYYEDRDEYERDLRYEYRKEDMPFYTDEPDDPHWQCENCAKCEECACGEEICDEFEEREE